MKRSVIFTALSVLSSFLCSISLFAQTGFDSAGQFEGYDFSTFTINGLEMAGPEYTEQDIIRAFGQPDSVELGEFGYIFLIGKDGIRAAGFGGTRRIRIYFSYWERL